MRNVNQGNVDYSVLLQRLRAADPNALDELYRHARMRLYAFAYTLVKDEAVAQDIVQELFIDLWQKQLFHQVHTGLVGYLMQATRNRCLDYLKRETNRERLRQVYFDGVAQTTLNTAEARALGEQIEAAMDSLPPMTGHVFRMHYLEQQSYAEIAEQLGISTNTVSNHMTKALKRLRRRLK